MFMFTNLLNAQLHLDEVESELRFFMDEMIKNNKDFENFKWEEKNRIKIVNKREWSLEFAPTLKWVETIPTNLSRES